MKQKGANIEDKQTTKDTQGLKKQENNQWVAKGVASSSRILEIIIAKNMGLQHDQNSTHQALMNVRLVPDLEGHTSDNIASASQVKEHNQASLISSADAMEGDTPREEEMRTQLELNHVGINNNIGNMRTLRLLEDGDDEFLGNPLGTYPRGSSNHKRKVAPCDRVTRNSAKALDSLNN